MILAQYLIIARQPPPMIPRHDDADGREDDTDRAAAQPITLTILFIFTTTRRLLRRDALHDGIQAAITLLPSPLISA